MNILSVFQLTIRKKYVDNIPAKKSDCSKEDLENQIDILRKQLEAKITEVETVNETNQNVRNELTKISDELFETKLKLIPRVASKAAISTSFCVHNPLCISRQPISPPQPCITFLVNNNTMYHEKLKKQGGVEYGTTNEDCMAVKYERY